jgi:hypothetical protein
MLKLILVIIIFLASKQLINKPETKRNLSSRPRTIKINTKAEQEEVLAKAKSIEKFATLNGYSQHYAFLLDFKIPSYQKRFFVVDLQNDSILYTGLVAHGSGSTRDTGMYFSNVQHSHCSSLGRYKIGNAYFGKFGLAYKLHGLDKTNNNAYKRNVVLHAHDCVGDEEDPAYWLCESQGCPTVSPNFLKQLDTIIKSEVKPVLLEVYY